jgi:hypothetical protein
MKTFCVGGAGAPLAENCEKSSVGVVCFYPYKQKMINNDTTDEEEMPFLTPLQWVILELRYL